MNSHKGIYTFCIFLYLLSTGTIYSQIDSIPSNHEKAFLLHSKILNEPRTLWIHFPASYSTSNQAYPVVYLLDGDGHFKYVSQMMEYLSGYDRNRIPEMIVVGIVNVDRGRDFTPMHPTLANGTPDSSKISSNSGAGKFLQYIQQEVVPYVEKNFRTQPYRILVGHSLGGLFALYAKETIPDLFESTILISPAIFGIHDKLPSDFGLFLKNHINQRGKMYVTIGNESTHGVDLIVKQLKGHAPESFQWSFRKYEDENHFSVTYKSIFDGLKFIYANWFIDFYSDATMSYKDIELRFEKLSNEFGYVIKPSEEFVNNCGYTQLRHGNISGAIDIFKQNIKSYPNSFNAYDSMGEAFMLNGEKELAILNYEKSISLNPNNENGKETMKKLKSK